MSQAKKIVSSRFSSQMRLISAMFSFLLSEVTVDPEHVQQRHTHTHTDEEAHDKFCFRHSNNKCNVVQIEQDGSSF